MQPFRKGVHVRNLSVLIRLFFEEKQLFFMNRWGAVGDGN